MKIGIDGRFLTNPQSGGFKTYVSNLVESLAEIDHEHAYWLYLDRQPSPGDLIPTRNFQTCVVESYLPVIGMPIREQFSLPREIARDSIDVMHFPTNTAPARFKGKSVLTLHDVIQLEDRQSFPRSLRPGEYKSWAIRSYAQWAIHACVRTVDHIITVSGYEKGRIVETFGLPPERITVVHNAPNPRYRAYGSDERLQATQQIQARFGLERPYLLGIGYEDRKNIPLLIEAFRLFQNEHPDFDLVIVASNRGRAAGFIEFANQLGIGERVHLLSHVASEELIALYNLAEVLVFPSEREGFGLPPLEAMACGTPVIAMRASSVPEVVGDAAVLISGKNPTEWCAAISTLLNDANRRDHLKAQGLARAAQFSWKRTAQETLQVYQSLT